MTYAEFWKRFGACFIDSFITIILSLVVSFIVVIMVGNVEIGKEARDIVSFITGIIIGIITRWIYFAAFESSTKQATLGKMALGIKVTDINGNRINFSKASGRHFGKIISALILSIGYLMAAFTSKKQGLHDKIAGCLVINK